MGVLRKPISRHFYHYGRLFSWFFNPIFCASQKCPDFRVSRWGFCVSQFHDISIIMADFFHRVGQYIFHGFSTPFIFASQKCPNFRVSRWGFCVSQFHDISIIMADFFSWFFNPIFLRPKNVPILGSVDGGFAISRHFYHYGRLFSWFFNPIFCASQKCPDFRVSRWGFCVSQLHDISIIITDFFIEWGQYIFHGFSTPFFCVPKMSRF